MGNEPIIPGTGEKLPDDSGYKDPNEESNGENGTNEAGKTEKVVDVNEGKPQVTQERLDKISEGWREDREFFESEIAKFKKSATSTKLTKEEEDELANLDEDERVERKIEIRQKREKDLADAEVKALQGEIRFYERTSTEFADNKKEILKVAEDYDCKTLRQAILVWKGLGGTKIKADAQYNDKRKKEAGGKPGGQAGGKTTIGKYDPKVDARKSFGDFYREGGVK